MNRNLITHPKYSGLYKLVDKFCNQLKQIHKEEIDSYLLFILLITYCTKFLQMHNEELTTENIYKLMEKIWSNESNRQELINYYSNSFPKQLLIDKK